MILKRVLKWEQKHWPSTHIILRGDSHFVKKELMELTYDDPLMDVMNGVSNNAVLSRKAKSTLIRASKVHKTRCHNQYIRQLLQK
jgi:hypothetical protein